MVTNAKYGVFHNIGGDNSKHVAWDSNNDETVEMHDFTENGYDDIWNPSAVYAPSKQMILLIGGIDAYQNEKMFGIWKFCLMKKKWKKTKELKFKYYNICSCLTSDQGYVIGSGIDADIEYMNKLYVLDVRQDDEYKLMECNIKLPMDNVNHTIVWSGGGIKD